VNLRNLFALLVALAIPLLVGGIGGFATARAIPTWYQGLEKPAWNPPDWVFGPVWTILYLLMGVAAWLIWRMGWEVPRVRIALGVFGLQLLLNLLWSLIFFGWQRPGLALLEITLLWFLVGITTLRFFSLEPRAGFLLVPYWLWTTFAAVLNASIWWLNRSGL
jgi:tryptophan-rich sensory protein